MIVRLGEALDEVRRWGADLAAHGRHIEARAAAYGWRIAMIPRGSGAQRVQRLYAEPLHIGDAFDPNDLAYTLPVRAVTFPTKRYASTRTVWAHPLDAVLLQANATPDAPVVVGARHTPAIAELRRFWRHHRRTSPKRHPLGGLRRFWRQNAALRVTVCLRSPGVAMDRDERIVYVDGPGPWWAALEAERIDLFRDIVTEWRALRGAVKGCDDLDRLDWLWDRMTVEQRAEAGRFSWAM